MLRRFALLTVLALACVAVAACGDDDSSSSPTLTQASSSSTPVPTVSGAPGFTLSITPSAVPGTPTPVPSTTPWQISGQLSGTPDVGVFSCVFTPGYYQVLLRGQLDGSLLSIFAFSGNAGTFDYADPVSALTISAQLGSPAEPVNDSWYETSGNRGVQGTVVIGTDGTGSMTDVVIPPSPDAPGGATETVTISGEWACPPLSGFY